ncbi:MAG: PAS domain-containing protein [Rhodobacteraceae bacterium]|nr:PAS domain-containing protein [Paracoccaceae bacterium]
MSKATATGGAVIAFRGKEPMIRSPLIEEVRGYWEALRDGRPAPARAEIDPRGIDRALGHMMLMDRIAPGHARLRVAGQHLCDLMGMEVRGMPLGALLALPAREALATALQTVFHGRCGVVLGLHAGWSLGTPAIDGQMLLLPLADRDGVLAHALGCIATTGTIGRAPRRFVITEVRHLPIMVTRRDEREPVLPVPALAEGPATYRPQRPALHLVQTRN